jgi:hypothetical protein
MRVSAAGNEHWNRVGRMVVLPRLSAVCFLECGGLTPPCFAEMFNDKSMITMEHDNCRAFICWRNDSFEQKRRPAFVKTTAGRQAAAVQSGFAAKKQWHYLGRATMRKRVASEAFKLTVDFSELKVRPDNMRVVVRCLLREFDRLRGSSRKET